MALKSSEAQQVRELVFKSAGIVLDAGKDYLIEARLGTLVTRAKLPSISALLSGLRKPDAMVTERDVIDAMTTNETSFFRDIVPFDVLRTSVVPELIAKRSAERRLTIWCAASSTGQEPYSILMSLFEAAPQLAKWNIYMVASDLSRPVLARARAGRYSPMEVGRGLSPQMLDKYFTKVGNEWEVRQSFRDLIDFREVNLLGTWPNMPPLDLIFVRNVMIYFNTETKKKILSRMRGLLRPDGYLFLGGAETTLNLDDQYERTKGDTSGCYRLRSRLAA
jgi:chemotaxis protein methyltransferase CheR